MSIFGGTVNYAEGQLATGLTLYTPAVGPLTGGSTVTPGTTLFGGYYLVGNLVYVQIQFSITAVAGAVSTPTFTLPFPWWDDGKSNGSFTTHLHGYAENNGGPLAKKTCYATPFSTPNVMQITMFDGTSAWAAPVVFSFSGFYIRK